MRVGELASRTGVSPRSLRYYEQHGLLHPARTAAGQRLYRAEDEATVLRIQELFHAGFCSAVIQELLPALSAPERDDALLDEAFAQARARLESEQRSIEAELASLDRLRDGLGLASDMRVKAENVDHDPAQLPHATAFDHRDRRLR